MRVGGCRGSRQPEASRSLSFSPSPSAVAAMVKVSFNSALAQKEAAKKDMGRMLDYIDMLNQLDTEGVEPMSHVFPVHNVFREDVVTNGDDRENMLANAPEQRDGAFVVPRTVE